MKILQVCSKTPYSPKDGGGIAMKMLMEGLAAEGNTVHVMAVSTPKHFINDADIDAAYKNKTAFHSVFIDTSVKPFAAFLNLFSSDSYNVSRFYSKEFEKVLIKKIKEEQYELIQLESLWVTPYLDAIRKHSKAKVVLRSHNIEYLIWERLADTCGSPLKKVYLNMLASRLKRYELSMLNKYDSIVMITDVDAAVYKKAGCTVPVITVPFGIDLSGYVQDASALEKHSLFHIGAMDWQPNIDGINWFLRSVWILVNEKHPDVKLYLAGRNMTEEIKDLKLENVIVEGEVADSNRFINSKSIMIVPLLSGGGMRVKIIEGMALGKTIVSTTIGAEGIAYEDGKNILIADTEAEFASALDKCLSDRSFSDQIGQNARALVEVNYDNKHICSKLSDFYKTL